MQRSHGSTGDGKMPLSLSIVTVKLWFKKVWVWFKKNWKFVSGVFLAVAVMLIAGKSPNLRSVINRIKEDYDKEIDVIEKAHKQEIEDRDVALKRYSDSIDQIEKSYKDKREKLDSKKKKEIEKVILENSKDPDEITRRISEITGFQVHIS